MHFIYFFFSLILMLISGASLVGCDQFDYHPYDTRFSGDRDIIARNVQRIEQQLKGRKSMCIAVMSDTQRWYDDTHKIVAHINANPEVDFVIHCGDLTDFSLTDEFIWMRDELQQLKVPYVVALGNHDCLGTGKTLYAAMFGAFEYSFPAGDTHFVVLNTNGLEFPYDPEFYGAYFLKHNLKTVPQEVKRTVVVMHVPPGSDQYPLERADAYLAALAPYPNPLFGVCGHEHSTSIRNPFPNHMTYYQAACAEKRSYLLFHLKEDGSYTYEEIRL